MNLTQFSKHHLYFTGAFVGSLSLLLFLIFTNPETVPVGALVVPAVLLFLISFCMSHLVLTVLRLLNTKPRKQRIVALVSATFVTVITILASTGGISATDLLLLGMILTIVTVYIDKF